MNKFLFVTLFLAMGCGAQTSNKLSVDEFEKQLNANSAAILLDVRTPEEFAERHLKEALNINFNGDDFEAKIDGLDKTKTVFVYCLSGGRSAKATDLLTKKGYNVYELQGGILAWANAGKPLIETVSEKGISMDNYLASVTKEKLVLVDFNAVWCGPCKKLKPIVHKVVEKNEQKVELFELDIDENSTLADKMHIDQIPLLILYKNGKEVWRNFGLIEEVELEKVLQVNGE